MTTNPLWITLEPDGAIHALRQQAVERLGCCAGELVLDCASLPRIDSSMAGAFENLANLAAQASVKVLLRAVNIDVYRVLALLNLTERFSFIS